MFNPALLAREELIGSFLVREAELGEILAQVRAATPDHAPQHLLVIGWRGMGKTTLLHRVAYAAEDDAALSKEWQPVLFDEEQFNVGELADFWLNGLEMLGQACGDPKLRREAERLVDSYRDDALEEASHDSLKAAAERLGKRLLLLVDNVDMVLDRLDEREASRLREVLQHEPWLILVGTSSRAIESTYEYSQPFYEMFKVIELAPLEDGETLNLLGGLADRYEAPQVAQIVEAQPSKIARLKLLMGGNPRTVALLFGVLQEGSEGDLWGQLERILDASTSLYKDRLESLPVQAQRIFDSLAQHWDPATAEKIAERLRLERGAVSAQLHRLVAKGLVEKVKLPGRALGFQVRERFFNIWCLMRGKRRSRERLRWLVEFMELFYDEKKIHSEAEKLKTDFAVLSDGVPTDQMERLVAYADVLAKLITVPSDRLNLYKEMLKVIASKNISSAIVDTTRINDFALSGELSSTEAFVLLAASRVVEQLPVTKVGFEVIDNCLTYAIENLRGSSQELEIDVELAYIFMAGQLLSDPKFREVSETVVIKMIREGLERVSRTGGDETQTSLSLFMVVKSFVDAGLAAEFSTVLDETGWSPRIQPLREALAVVSREDPERLARLSPELRQLSLEALEYLEGA